MSRPSVFFDNVDELRNEYDWMYEFMSRMAEQIRGNPDVHSLHDYVEKIESENDKLRKLCKLAFTCIEQGEDEYGTDWSCVGCEFCDKCDGLIQARATAQELGIEVDE